MSEECIEISEKEIADHLFNMLTMLGYAVKTEEIDDIAAIVFDYIMELFNADWEWEDEE